MNEIQAAPRFSTFDDYRPTVSVTVVVRWLLLTVWVFVLYYRIDHDATWVVLQAIAWGLAGLNAYVTWRILELRHPAWRG